MKCIGIIVIIICAVLASCNNNHEKPNVSPQTATPKVSDTTVFGEHPWADSSVQEYIAVERSQATKYASWAYMMDTTRRDGRMYVIVRIGLNGADRFVTERIIYVDSATKDVYEYRYDDDSLERWNGTTRNHQ